MFCDLWARGRVEDVRLDVVHQVCGVGCGAVIAAEHVLRVSRVAVSPGAVVQVVDLAGAVVALVECDGDEALGAA